MATRRLEELGSHRGKRNKHFRGGRGGWWVKEMCMGVVTTRVNKVLINLSIHWYSGLEGAVGWGKARHTHYFLVALGARLELLDIVIP